MDASISNPSPCRRVSLGGCGCSTKKRRANQLSRPEERLSAGEAGHPPAVQYYPSIGARGSTLLTHISCPCFVTGQRRNNSSTNREYRSLGSMSLLSGCVRIELQQRLPLSLDGVRRMRSAGGKP